jgi:hypothetical protein
VSGAEHNCPRNTCLAIAGNGEGERAPAESLAAAEGWLSRLTGLLVVLDAVRLGFFTVIGAQRAEPARRPRRRALTLAGRPPT